MSALPHLLYGPGDDALALTVEYGGIVDKNSTQEAISKFSSCLHSLEKIEADQCTDITRICSHYHDLKSKMPTSVVVPFLILNNLPHICCMALGS
jgi:hypothetical protein